MSMLIIRLMIMLPLRPDNDPIPNSRVIALLELFDLGLGVFFGLGGGVGVGEGGFVAADDLFTPRHGLHQSSRRKGTERSESFGKPGLDWSGRTHSVQMGVVSLMFPLLVVDVLPLVVAGLLGSTSHLVDHLLGVFFLLRRMDGGAGWRGFFLDLQRDVSYNRSVSKE